MAITDFLEPAVKDYAEQAKATYSAPIDTSTFTGRQFVAGEDPLQTQAINIAQHCYPNTIQCHKMLFSNHLALAPCLPVHVQAKLNLGGRKNV